MATSSVSQMDFSKDISEIKITVQRIESSMVSRSEIEANMKERLTLDVYQADKESILDRLVRIETNPQKMIAWISAAIGCLGVCVALTSLIFTALIYFITQK